MDSLLRGTSGVYKELQEALNDTLKNDARTVSYMHVVDEMIAARIITITSGNIIHQILSYNT